MQFQLWCMARAFESSGGVKARWKDRFYDSKWNRLATCLNQGEVYTNSAHNSTNDNNISICSSYTGLETGGELLRHLRHDIPHAVQRSDERFHQVHLYTPHDNHALIATRALTSTPVQ